MKKLRKSIMIAIMLCTSGLIFSCQDDISDLQVTSPQTTAPSGGDTGGGSGGGTCPDCGGG